MSAPRRQPRPMGRREFLHRAASLTAVTATSTLWTPRLREAWARTHGTVVAPAGTTLESFIWFEGGANGGLVKPDRYTRLTRYAPGWPIEVRSDFADPRPGREDRRVALAAFCHGTDYQFPDAQSPARVEFLARYADEPTPSFLSSAQRPQEALIVQATEALHRQICEIGVGPVTGRPLDFAIATGDNYDNKQLNELQWFLTLMGGGTLAANSGAADRFEGVQNFDGLAYDDWYYHPDDDLELPPGAPPQDQFKRNFGYPDHPGLLEAAIVPFTASGLGLPWYQTYGNHDALVQGNERVNDAYAGIVVGSQKVLHPAGGIPSPGAFFRALAEQDPDALALYFSLPTVEVTADENRRFVFDREYVRLHLDAGGQPHGHGFDEWNLDNAYLFYAFDIGPSVLGISLDTCAGILSQGAIGAAQLRWLEERLIEVHSHYFDRDGAEVRTGYDDRLVVLFGHHPIDSIQPNPVPRQVGGKADEADAPDTFRGPDGYVYRREEQHGGQELLALLQRFPNVIAYVNGHGHFNGVTPRPDTSGRTAGLWEITTSAVLDPPQQGRIIEIADNRDGTVSIFATVVDHAGPATTDRWDDVLSIASVARELAFNDYQARVEGKVGAPGDRNVELVLPAPFALSETPQRLERRPVTPPGPPPERPPVLPATGSGLAASLGAAALAGAIALRRRHPDSG